MGPESCHDQRDQSNVEVQEGLVERVAESRPAR